MEPKGIVAASQPQWISVKDALPDMEKWVLVWNNVMGYDVDMIREDGRWALTNDPITHWMPLPEPPEEVSYE